MIHKHDYSLDSQFREEKPNEHRHIRRHYPQINPPLEAVNEIEYNKLDRPIADYNHEMDP